jgi:hypothetical protein
MKKIFICYSHKDKKFKDEICDFLKHYEAQFEEWNDRKIEAGSEWKKEIEESLNSCDAAILIISNDFLISKFIKEIELPTLLRRREVDNINIFPFILKHCNWKDIIKLQKIQAKPTDGNPFNAFKRPQKDKILTDFSKEISLIFSKEISNSDINIINNSTENDKDDGAFIDILYSYFKEKFEDITVLPSNLFLNEYPFKNENKVSYRSNFTLNSENENLTDFFKSFEISKKGEITSSHYDFEEIQKIEFIVEKLVNSNILHFSSRNQNVHKDLYLKSSFTESYYQLFDRFKYLDSFKLIPNIENLSLKGLMELGYFYYKLGDLIKSKETFELAKILSKKNEKDLSFLICNHNLFHLGRLINYRYWTYPNKQKIVDELTSINLNNIEVSDNKKYLKEYLISRNFLNEPKQKMMTLTEKVVEYYYSYLRGSVSTNNYEWEILYEYSTLSSFLNKNFIIYDFYIEYKDIVHTLLNSVLASYSIKNGDNRIVELDIFLVSHLIEYGEAKTINQLFKRYQIDDIEYSNKGTNYNIIRLLENFVNNPKQKLNEFFKEPLEEKHGLSTIFNEKRDSIFKNILMLSSVINFTEKEVEKISNLIIKYIKNGAVIKRFDLDFLFKFLNFKCQFIPNKHFNYYISYLILNQEYNLLINNFSSLSHNLKTNNIIINFTEKEFDKIKDKIIFNNPNGDLQYEIAIGLFGILEDNYKMFITSKLKLEFDNNKNFELFFNCVIFDIIEYHYQNYFDDFIDNYKIGKASDFGIGKSVQRIIEVDDIFNICFKFGTDIKHKRFNKFKKISKYYEWLLDIDNFDYEDFKTHWIAVYSTKYYFAYFRRSDKLKVKLKAVLSKNNDNYIKKIYTDIYC